MNTDKKDLNAFTEKSVSICVYLWRLAGEDGYGLDVIGLREEVEGGDVLEGVTAFDEPRRISRQCGWVAGDVGDGLRVDLQNGVEGVFVETCAGRVNDHVDGFSQLWREGGEDFFGGAFVEFDVVEFVEVDGEVFAGRWRGFDADDFGVFVREEFAE